MSAEEKRTKAEIEADNQEAILQATGLETTTETLSGKTFITKNGATLTATEIMDTYYPELFTKIVQQSILEYFRGAKGLDAVFSHEEWTNGIKDLVYTGILKIEEYDKAITIEDFNAADPTIQEFVVSIDQRRFTKIVRTRAEILTAFTNPAALSSFIALLIKQLKSTFEIEFQNEKAIILAQGAEAKLVIEYDDVVNTIGMETIDIVKDMENKLLSYGTASAEHTLIGRADETLVYSGSMENFIVVYNQSFKVSQEFDIAAKLFHPQHALLNVESTTIDFNKIKGLEPEIAESIKAIILDKDALKMGFQIENVSNVINLPKLQVLLENHNWYGYARYKTYPMVMYKDVVVVPE